MGLFQGPRRDPQISVRDYVAVEPHAPEHSRWAKYIGAAAGVLMTPYFQGLPEVTPPWLIALGLLGFVVRDWTIGRHKVQSPT